MAEWVGWGFVRLWRKCGDGVEGVIGVWVVFEVGELRVRNRCGGKWEG